MKFEENWPRGSQEKSFKGVDGRRVDGETVGRRTASDYNSSSWAKGSGELKTLWWNKGKDSMAIRS